MSIDDTSISEVASPWPSESLVKANAKTDIGKRRTVNQDAYRFREPGPTSPYGVFVIADGVSGDLPFGEIASETAVATFFTRFYELPDNPDEQKLVDRVHMALMSAHEAVREQATQRGAPKIATTIAGIVMSSRGTAVVFNVGDTRVYRIRGDRMEQLTQDQVTLRDSILSHDELESGRRGTQLASYLGQPDPLKPYYARILYEQRDTFVICTDGMWAQLGESVIFETVRNNTIDDAVNQLVELVLAKNAPDNLTVCIVRIGQTEVSDGVNTTGVMLPAPRTISPVMMALAGSLIAILVVIIAILILSRPGQSNGADQLTPTVAALVSSATASSPTVPAQNAALTAATTAEATAEATALDPTQTQSGSLSETTSPDETQVNTSLNVAGSLTQTAMPTLTFTLSSTSTLTPTSTHTATLTHTSAPSATATLTHTAAPTSTSTATATATSSPTVTATLTSSPTATATFTETSSPTFTATSTPTTAVTDTATPTFTATLTSTPTPTATATSSPTMTATPTPVPNFIPTKTIISPSVSLGNQIVTALNSFLTTVSQYVQNAPPPAVSTPEGTAEAAATAESTAEVTATIPPDVTAEATADTNAVYGVAISIKKGVNVRSGPGTGQGIRFTLPATEKFEILERTQITTISGNEEWYFILASGNRGGWVSALAVNTEGDLSSIPFFTSTPSPSGTPIGEAAPAATAPS